MENLIYSLKSSPIFNLSLTSKELFHSNFIAWLAREYPSIIGNIFAKHIGLSETYTIKPETIKREENHIDLMFDIIDVQDAEAIYHIIIENKVKSLPYINQLSEYSKKTKDKEKTKFILLSLSIPFHLLTNENDKIIDENKTEWHYISYDCLANDLESSESSFIYKLVDKVDSTLDALYHKMIIADYLNFIKLLSEINKKTKIENKNEKYNWYNDEVFKALKNPQIRMSDFYIKKKCEYMINLIFEEVKKMNIGNVGSMSISSSIVHSTDGEFRFYYSFNERTYVSVEISRMYYRKLVYVSNEKKEGKIVHKYKAVFEPEKDVVPFFNDLNWFNFDKIPESKKDTTYKSYKNFNSFGNAKYCQCRLNENNNVNEIINYFKEDLTFIISKSDLINQKFTI